MTHRPSRCLLCDRCWEPDGGPPRPSPRGACVLNLLVNVALSEGVGAGWGAGAGAEGEFWRKRKRRGQECLEQGKRRQHAWVVRAGTQGKCPWELCGSPSRGLGARGQHGCRGAAPQQVAER